MPGPGPGSRLRRGGGGGQAGGWAPSLTLCAPARCSLSPSRLLLHLLLLSARGGRQGAGAPGPARSPRPRPERLAQPRHWLGRRDEGAGPRRGDTGPGEEAGGRDAATYGPVPRAALPSPAFPFSNPTRDICALRARGGSRGGASPGCAQAPGRRITWWRSGFPSPRGARERGVRSPPECRPRRSLASHRDAEIHPPRALRPGTLGGIPPRGRKAASPSYFLDAAIPTTQARLQSPALSSPLTGPCPGSESKLRPALCAPLGKSLSSSVPVSITKL